MRYTFDRYMQDIGKMTDEDGGFFAVLVHEAVTLYGLIRDGPSSRRMLGTDWLDSGILRDRLRAGIDWACELGWQPRTIPNFFLQGSDDEVDRLVFDFRKQEWVRRGTWGKRIAQDWGLLEEVPPEVHYLHTAVNWTPNLEFSNLRATGRWSIPSLYQYNNNLRTLGFQPKAQHRTLGYQVPELPQLLGVSGEVATEYVVRIMLHDLLHFFLPQIDTNEPVHNATCIVAGGAFTNRSLAKSTWEAFVLDECTDPCFSLELDRRAAEVRQLEGLTPLQRWYIDSFFQTALSSSAPARVRKLYGVEERTSSEAARATVIARALWEREKRWPSWVMPESVHEEEKE